MDEKDLHNPSRLFAGNERDPEPEDDESGRGRMDPELRAIGQVLRLLDRLSPPAKDYILARCGGLK